MNGTSVSGSGTLGVNSSQGTKDGTVTYSSPPPPGTPGGDSVSFGTTKCFTGARHLGKRRFPNPLELLGSEFISVRSTRFGRAGIVSLSEQATQTRGRLRSEIRFVGVLDIPYCPWMGPLREIIWVSGEDTLLTKGSYSLITEKEDVIPVQYTHFYHSLKPNKPAFRRMRNRVYLDRAMISSWVSRDRRKVRFHTESTLELLKGRGDSYWAKH
jgi:hypothetical protein